MPSQSSQSYYLEAIRLRDQIVSGRTNERPAQAWVSVCRECAKVNDAFRHEETGVHGRRHQAFLSNLDRVWWNAKAQVEHLAGAVA